VEREWLEEQLATGRSLQAIAEAAGRSASTVAYWIDKHGLVASHASRHAAKGPVEEAVLRDLVERGASTRDIAAELGRSQASVRHWLARFGLRTALAVGRGGDKPATAVRRCDVHGEVAFRLYEGYRYRCPACVSAAVAEHRRQRKALLVAEAGGRCAVCGYSRYAGALQFHHWRRSTRRSPSASTAPLAPCSAFATKRRSASSCVGTATRRWKQASLSYPSELPM
jgi:hypothetical protein